MNPEANKCGAMAKLETHPPTSSAALPTDDVQVLRFSIWWTREKKSPTTGWNQRLVPHVPNWDHSGSHAHTDQFS